MQWMDKVEAALSVPRLGLANQHLPLSIDINHSLPANVLIIHPVDEDLVALLNQVSPFHRNEMLLEHRRCLG